MMNVIRQQKKRTAIVSMLLVMLLVCTTFLSSFVLIPKAEDYFVFDGSNANEYAGETLIRFDMTRTNGAIDSSNLQVQSLLDQCQSLGENYKFKFEKSVLVIGKEVFQNLYNLESVDFSSATNLYVIQDRAFAGCIGLDKCIYSNGTSTITSAAKVDSKTGKFQFQFGLPANLSYFGEACFEDCSITDYALSESNKNFTSLDGVILNKTQNTLIAFPPGRAGTYRIPETVQTVYQYAFESSLIEKVTIPENVKTIGKRAFFNSKLVNVAFSNNNNLSIGVGAFYQDPERLEYASSQSTEWKGIKQVQISYSTYQNSSLYIDNIDDSACFTPYVSAADSKYGYPLGCDVFVVPEVKVSGLPITWTASANLNFIWENTNYYTITGLFLDENREVSFDPGSTSSSAVTITKNDEYKLVIEYQNKNGNTSSTVMYINIDKIDSNPPGFSKNTPDGEVTYTMVDDVCYLHTFDTESGVDQIKYMLNNSDVINYADGFRLNPGKNVLTVWATDNVGNTSKENQYIINVAGEDRYIKLNSVAKQLGVGDKYGLKVSFEPANVQNTDVKWSTSDQSIATVSGTGVVTGVNVGRAVITATSTSGYTAKCAIVVTKDPATKSEISMFKADTYKLSLSNVRDDYDVTFESDDTNVCTVSSSGKITAKNIGEATVITTVDTGVRVYQLETVVTVKKVGVKITRKKTLMSVGATYKFKALRTGLKSKVKWSSSNKNVATVNTTTGKVIAQSRGVTTITAKCGKYKSSCKLTIK